MSGLEKDYYDDEGSPKIGRAQNAKRIESTNRARIAQDWSIHAEGKGKARWCERTNGCRELGKAEPKYNLGEMDEVNT